MIVDRPTVEFRPSYVPDGYTFGLEVRGEAAGGFGDLDDQVALVFWRHRGGTDRGYRLAVHVAAGGDTALSGTEGRPAQPIDLGLPGVTAAYHDGWWTLGPGEDARYEDGLVTSWDRSDVHSITVSSGSVTWAVRGTRSRGVGFDELLAVARSITPSTLA